MIQCRLKLKVSLTKQARRKQVNGDVGVGVGGGDRSFKWVRGHASLNISKT